MSNVKIGVVGCGGRMGRMVLSCLRDTAGAEVAGGTDAPGVEAVGQDLGDLAGVGAMGMAAGDDPVALFAQSDAVIDFTAPAASLAHAELAAQAKAAQAEAAQTEISESNLMNALFASIIASPNANKVGYLLALR